MFGGTEVVLQALNFAASVFVITILFAAIYKFLPKTPIAWRDVWEGALITSILFEIGKLLIGLYIGKSSVASEFGSAGPFVVLMVWIYYSTQVFLFGAEVTCVVAKGHAALASAGVPKGTVVASAAPSISPAPVRPALTASRAPVSLMTSRDSEGASAASRILGASAAGLLAGWIAARIARARQRVPS
jgi:membrane protein